jgi:hypothetical protein
MECPRGLLIPIRLCRPWIVFCVVSPQKSFEDDRFNFLPFFFFCFWHLGSSDVLVYTNFFQETNKPDGHAYFMISELISFLSLAALKTEQFHKMWSIVDVSLHSSQKGGGLLSNRYEWVIFVKPILRYHHLSSW